MAATTTVPVTLETPIAVKVLFQGHTKKFKLPLRDLGAHVLPEKVCPSRPALARPHGRVSVVLLCAPG